MILDRRKVALAPNVIVELPLGSIPRQFINQAGELFLWFENSNETVLDAFAFRFVPKGEVIPLGTYMQMVKIGPYQAVYRN